MKLFLIRHAETVDNVAGIYAGVRDSVLTNHGVDQAARLGDYLAKTNVVLTHAFASPLIRTSKTAEAVRKAQSRVCPDAADTALEIVKVPELIEQNFGYYEGKPFQARAADSRKTGREVHRDKHKEDADFVDVESKDSMAKRADRFLDEHLLPLFDSDDSVKEHTVAIVSHGILLSNLWRRLLLRLPRKSLTIVSEVMATKVDIVLEHLGGWSNTGYLHLEIRRTNALASCEGDSMPKSERSDAIAEVQMPLTLDQQADASSKSSIPDNARGAISSASPKALIGHSTKILAIDSKQHLLGLKRQRGGIGRSAHDESQKRLDGFFKKQRAV